MRPLHYPGKAKPLTEEERKVLIAKVSAAYLGVQHHYQETYAAADIMPELISAMLSLSLFLARTSAGLSRPHIEVAIKAALDEEYSTDV
jgi:hypothetical protein